MLSESPTSFWSAYQPCHCIRHCAVLNGSGCKQEASSSGYLPHHPALAQAHDSTAAQLGTWWKTLTGHILPMPQSMKPCHMLQNPRGYNKSSTVLLITLLKAFLSQLTLQLMWQIILNLEPMGLRAVLSYFHTERLLNSVLTKACSPRGPEI